jgi:acyl-CoA synthetase (AMP-forming)/AMP-acid ligase II
MNLFSLLDQSAGRFGARPAAFLGREIVFTYGDLRHRALRLAHSLRREYRRGDRIAIASKNDPSHLVVMFGVWAAGMVLVPINAKLHVAEMRDIITDSGARIVFASADLAGALEAQAGTDLRVIDLSCDRFDALLQSTETRPVDVPSDTLAWLFYTSGTTGRSKGAMLSHRNLLSMTASHLADFEDISEEDCIIHAAPLSHGSGLYVLPYVARGAAHVVPASRGFEASEFIDLCAAHEGCGAFMAPTMVRRLREEVEATRRSPDHLRSIVYGGGPMYLEEIKSALGCFGPIFRQLYGQGESPMTITGMRQRDFADRSDLSLRSVGWPRTGVEVRVIDERGNDLPAEQPGEIVCRGDVVMGGYWNNSDATRQAFIDGWLRTGDVGSFDEQGRLTLQDRSKEVIISGGTNIYPREVEEALLAHPAIREVAVFARTDDDWGETVAACVAFKPGCTASVSELDRTCLERIARFKRPKSYCFVEELPKSNYGKVLKRVISQDLASGALSVQAVD